MATEEGRAELQDALTKLEHWADRWGMEFNISKCKVMHFGRNNPRHDYRMKGRLLEKTEEERDLGVMTMASAKPAAQCTKPSLGRLPGPSTSGTGKFSWDFTGSISDPTWNFPSKPGHHGAKETRSC